MTPENYDAGVSVRQVCQLAAVVQFREPTVWQQYGNYIAAGLTIFPAAECADRDTHLAASRSASRRARGGFHERTPADGARERTATGSRASCTMTLRSGWRPLPSRRRGSIAGTCVHHRRLRGPSAMALVKLSEDVHALSYRLHPSVIDDLGLVEALKAECDRVGACLIRQRGMSRRAKSRRSCRRTRRCVCFVSRRKRCATSFATPRQALSKSRRRQ